VLDPCFPPSATPEVRNGGAAQAAFNWVGPAGAEAAGAFAWFVVGGAAAADASTPVGTFATPLGAGAAMESGRIAPADPPEPGAEPAGAFARA